jgi:hypothetical protein
LLSASAESATLSKEVQKKKENKRAAAAAFTLT